MPRRRWGVTQITWTSPSFGLSAAERHVVLFDDGTRAFVKGATDPETAAWLTNEFHVLEQIGGRFGPEVLAWLSDDQHPVLITDDLSSAYWPAASGRRDMPDWLRAVFRRLAVIEFTWMTEIMGLRNEPFCCPRRAEPAS